MEYRVSIERRHDGDYRWVRRPSARSRAKSRRTSDGRRRASRSYVADSRQQNVVEFKDIEFLIGIYAATGEGRGSFLAAARAEEIQRELQQENIDDYEDFRRTRRRLRPGIARRPQRPPRNSSDTSSDNDGGPGPSQIPPQTPPDKPSGGPATSSGDAITGAQIPIPMSHSAHIYQETHAPPSRPTPSSTIPDVHGRPNLDHNRYEDERRRRRRADFSFRPGRHADADDNYISVQNYATVEHPGSINVEARRPERLVRSRSRHRPRPSSYIVQPGARTSSTTQVSESQHRRRESFLHSASPPVNVSATANPEYDDTERVARHHTRQEFSDNTDDEVTYTSMPVEEDAIRVCREAEMDSRASRLPSQPRRRAAVPREEASTEYVRLRGGDGSLDRAGFFGHLRGGALPVLPTRTSPIGAGLIPKGNVDTTSREIELYFYYSKHGKVITSGICERYTTFQEFIKPPEAAPDRSQLNDVWFVKKLQEHYRLLNRRQHSLLWDLVSVKTIGFASFIRFERTVSPSQDLLGFSVTAKVPAIVAETEAEAQFKYSLKYPNQNTKLMLYLLDWLASTSHPKRPCFYVVEIKEAADITKTYAMLLGLIIISTAGGTVYAVVQSDPGTGLSISSYVLTVLSLILAFVTAADWLGLKSPDSFAFAYNVERNAILGAIGIENLPAGAMS